jgi:excisionase family DNA binding protein
MEEKEFLSTSELAKILGISRIAVHKKIKKGEIKAAKVGRNYVIAEKDLGGVLERVLSPQSKKELTEAVRKTIGEYGETLRLLGKE